MSGCTPCEGSLGGGSPFTISLVKSGSDVLVYAQNSGRNIVVMKRLLLCREWSGGGMTINYLRKGDFIVGGEEVEPGLTQLKYSASASGAVAARAQAEYIEITGRSLSCELDLT